MQVTYKDEKGKMYIVEAMEGRQFGYYVEDYLEKFPEIFQDHVYVAIWETTDEDLWEESKRDTYEDLDIDDESLTLLAIHDTEENISDFSPRSPFLTKTEDERFSQSFDNVMETIDALMHGYHAKRVQK